MAGKTLFLKFNTGPSGHGMPPAAGEALALKLAGCEDVRVFAVEGEGGLTPGASHETRNAAWGLGLSNLVFLIDWNDFGIDQFRASSVVPGTPESWFAAYDWRVSGTPDGMEWAPVTRAVLEAARGENPGKRPSVAWFRTRKGRGYGKYDAPSHGTPHPMNAPEFWAVRHEFMAKYGVAYEGVDEAAPADAEARARQAEANLRLAAGVLRGRRDVVEAISDRLVELADRVPEHPATFNLGSRGARLVEDPRIFDYRAYPPQIWKQPGREGPQPGRAGRLGRLGQLVREGRVRPSALHRRVRRPRRVDQPGRVRQGLRRPGRLGLVRARHEPDGARSCRPRSRSSPTRA